MKKKKDPLSVVAEATFWSEFYDRDVRDERYLVYNKLTGEVIVDGARLTRKKRRAKV